MYHPIKSIVDMACRKKHLLTCHAERSEASGLTSRTAWATPDASLPLSMTRERGFLY